VNFSYKCCFLFFVSTNAFPATYQKVSNGYWDDSLTWASHTIPPYNTSDTIFIRDSIRFASDIYLQSGALMQIDSGGGLCGHETINIHTGALLSNSGSLEVDRLIVQGGNFENVNSDFCGFLS
jgi:hypothetical protein